MMRHTTLQIIDATGPLGGDALGWLLDTLTSAFGGPGLFGLFLGALLFVVLYVAADGNLTVPTVALVLTGTVTVSMVPGQYQQLAVSVVVIGVAAALWQAAQRYVLEGVR